MVGARAPRGVGGGRDYTEATSDGELKNLRTTLIIYLSPYLSRKRSGLFMSAAAAVAVAATTDTSIELDNISSVQNLGGKRISSFFLLTFHLYFRYVGHQFAVPPKVRLLEELGQFRSF